MRFWPRLRGSSGAQQRPQPAAVQVRVTRPFRFMVGDYHMVCPRVGDLVEGELAEVAIGLGRGRRVVERGEAGSAAALVPRHAG